MKADDILAVARQQLKDFIVYESMILILHRNTGYPNWENGEDWTIRFSDILSNEEVRVSLSVFDSDDDTAHNELYALDSIHISLDENLFFWDKDLEEHHYGELKIDDLAEIANILEKAVKDIFKK